jgi:hypothetical protein
VDAARELGAKKTTARRLLGGMPARPWVNEENVCEKRQGAIMRAYAEREPSPGVPSYWIVGTLAIDMERTSSQVMVQVV